MERYISLDETTTLCNTVFMFARPLLSVEWLGTPIPRTTNIFMSVDKFFHVCYN
jgi:hypothetical protein